MSTPRKRLDQISEAQKLLALATPATDYLPERIEACEVMAFDVQEHINSLKDQAGRIEEEATASANGESNADKRKAARLEYLRECVEYGELQTAIYEAERVKLKLDSRAGRLTREHRARLLAHEITHLGRRS